jgi:enoyl-CoA hydratase
MTMPAVADHATQFETLLYEVDSEGVCTITLNRPDKLNAIDLRVLNELEQAFSAAAKSDDVVGVILTGAGDRAFAAGANIQQFTKLNVVSGHDFALRGQEIFNTIENLPKPVVAAVNGYALGGGCELALACHLRVATEGARFGQPEVNLGLIPGYGGTQRLPRIVGRAIATEMILTGDHITAQRAYEIGLVNRVSSAEGLLATARQLILIIASRAPVAVAMALRAIRASDQPLSQGLEMEAVLFGQVCGTEDFHEGVGAFLSKRAPEFKGR